MLPPNLALLLWVPVVLYLFRWLPVQRAMIISFIAGFLFLPQYAFSLPFLIPGGRMAITTYAVVLGSLLFAIEPLKLFRLHWLDLPMLVFCLCPFATSISNDLGWFDGFKEVMSAAVTWGIPYFLGRIYLGSLEGLRKLAFAILIGGLIYVPLCLIESFVGPQLHLKIYGINAFADWSQARRWGGWRPVVFMSHGLHTGLWMMGSALISVWFWKLGLLKTLFGMRMKWLSPILIITFLWVKSTGAWLYMIMGLAVLFTARWFRTSLMLIALISAISFYLYLSATGSSTSDQIVSVVQQTLGEERAGSIEYRFMNEELLRSKAQEQIIFGWGGSGRSRPRSVEDGSELGVTDSVWIILLGTKGLVGLISWLTAFLLPLIVFLRCYPAYLWHHPKVAPAAVLVVIVALFVVDNLLNSPSAPVYLIATGGILGSALPSSNAKKSTGVNLIVAEKYLHHQ